jgi:release factor glutamine methyltransferase
MAPTAVKQSWTVLELLNWTTDHFNRAGIENPRLNAEVLLGHVLGLERIMLYARFDQQVSEAHKDRFRELVRRRASREPLQYLTGRCEFYGRQFDLTPAVMVPRQETELLVDKCLEKIGQGEFWAADVCTGSGVIAVTLAAEQPLLRVVATDSSAEAIEVAARNAAKHGVADRVLLAAGDLTEPVRARLPAGLKGVDLLASNPPYVPTAVIEQLDPEVRDHEPRAALDGGPDGLGVVRRLVPEAARILAPGGWLVMELGEGEVDAVRNLVRDAGAFAVESIETVADSGGCERVFCVHRAPH